MFAAYLQGFETQIVEVIWTEADMFAAYLQGFETDGNYGGGDGTFVFAAYLQGFETWSAGTTDCPASPRSQPTYKGLKHLVEYLGRLGTEVRSLPTRV